MVRKVLFAAITVATASGQPRIFSESPDHAAINYAITPADDRVVQLNAKIRDGKVQLKVDGPAGYLRSVLDALDIPVEPQMVVFAKTSLQAAIIGPRNPRAIFFNDSLAAGWVRDEPFVEIAAQDPRQGTIFYTLIQQSSDRPQFVRRNDCVVCHVSYSSLGVPGMLLRSVFPAPNGAPERTLGDYNSDHRSPFEQRWGGWFVTGNTGSLHHMGNTIYTDPNNADAHIAIDAKWDSSVYLSDYSDVVALMVFEHQMRMMNLLTQFGWEIRVAAHDERAFDPAPDAREIVDYMLFIDEPPLREKIRGTSGFAEKFAGLGPRDARGRSLRDFDLDHRLMRYPCSYMIYSDAFEALPLEGKDSIYRRMRQVLSGKERDAKYAALSPSDRQAIVEILRDTKHGFENRIKEKPHD